MTLISRAAAAFAALFVLLSIAAEAGPVNPVAPAVINITSTSDAAVRAAFTTAAASPGQAYILNMPNGPVTLTAPLPALSNVQVMCVPPMFTAPSPSILDHFILSEGVGQGTVFIGNGSFDAFDGNTTPLSSPGTFTGWISNFSVSHCGFDNFLHAVNIGAHNSPGLAGGGLFDNWIENSTGPAYSLTNMTIVSLVGNHIRTAANVRDGCGFLSNDSTGGVYSAGNIPLWTDFCNGPGFGLYAPPGEYLGSIRSVGLQVNKGYATYTASITPVNGSPNWPVSDLTKWLAGNWVTIATTADGLTQNVAYVVTGTSGSAGTGSITLALCPDCSNISSSGTTPISVTNIGWSDLEFYGGGTHIGDEFVGLDVESTGVLMSMDGLYGSLITGFVLQPNQRFVERSGSGFNFFQGDLGSAIFDSSGATTYDTWSGNAGTIVGTGPGGIHWNNGDNVGGLTISPGTPGGKDEVEESYGVATHYFPRNLPGGIAEPATAFSNCSISSLALYGGNLTFTGTSGSCTWTLPTLAGAGTPSLNDMGFHYRVTDAGSVALTIAAGGGQLINGVSGQTSVTIAPGQAVDCISGFGPASALQWNCVETYSMGPGLTVANGQLAVTNPAPATSVNGDIVTFDNATGGLGDSGMQLSSLAPLISPAFTTPNLGVPSAVDLLHATDIPGAAINAGSVGNVSLAHSSVTVGGQTAALGGSVTTLVPVMGNGTGDTAGSTTYFTTYGSSGAGSSDGARQQVAPISGHITGLSVSRVTAPGTGYSAVYTLRDNATSTAATCTISGTASSCSWSGSVAISAGDLLDISDNLTASGATSASSWGLTETIP